MHAFLPDSVPSELLRSAQKRMFAFLKEYEVLYGKQNTTSFLHIADCVREWVPLWNFLAYPCENINGRLVKLANSTKRVQWPIVEEFLILFAMPKLSTERWVHHQ